MSWLVVLSLDDSLRRELINSKIMDTGGVGDVEYWSAPLRSLVLYIGDALGEFCAGRLEPKRLGLE